MRMTTASSLLALALVASPAGLTACSSSPKPTQTCTVAVESDWWPSGSQGLAINRIADRLKVSTKNVESGSIGSATCERTLDLNEIASEEPPIVSVNHVNCLVVGPQAIPVKDHSTNLVLVFCPKGAKPTAPPVMGPRT